MLLTRVIITSDNPAAFKIPSLPYNQNKNFKSFLVNRELISLNKEKASEDKISDAT
jgi:hypothetical protein